MGELQPQTTWRNLSSKKKEKKLQFLGTLVVPVVVLVCCSSLSSTIEWCIDEPLDGDETAERRTRVRLPSISDATTQRHRATHSKSFHEQSDHANGYTVP